MEFRTFSHNGKLRPAAEAQVPLNWLEYSYGFGVYETVRYAGGVLYFLQDHVERLEGSARIIGLEHEFPAEMVERSVQELVDVVEEPACNIKILLIGGATAARAELFVMASSPLFPDRKLYRDGADVITYEYERAFPQAKTLNMLQSYIAYRKAKSAGAYDALLINRRGQAVEGTRTNFFALKGSVIYSPPEAEILLGVTRKAMLKAALAAGFELEYRNIALESLGNYDGCFITSTSSKIVPLRSVDGQVLSEKPPAELRRPMDVFGEFLEGCNGVLD